MSKVLKAIDAILLILFIVCGAALLVPQFMGISTVVVQQEMTGNVAVGTAVYARRTEASAIETGDRMLNLTSTSVDIYSVEAYDAETATVTVSGAPQTEYNVSEYYLKVVTTIPLIGYLMLATQSAAGLAILAGLLAYVIISFVFAEIFRRSEDDEDEEEESDEDDDFYAGLAARKKQRTDDKKAARNDSKKEIKSEKTKETAAEEKAERDEDSRSERPSRRRSRHAEEAAKRTDDRDSVKNAESRKTETGDISVDSLPDVQAALEAALVNQPLNRTENTNPSLALEADDGEPSITENGEIELAMPVRTADELLQKAYAEGLDPTVREDNITGVTLVDYSDAL